MKRRYASPRNARERARASERKRLGLRLRRLREGRAQTQTFIGHLLGCRPSNVNHIEAGRQGVTLDQLRVLAKHYGCTVDDLVDVDASVPVMSGAHRD